MRKLWFIITCLGLVACYAFAVSPSEKYQIDNFKVSTLKGLSGVALTIKIVRDNPTTLELLREVDLQRDIEFIFQKAGVNVLRPTPEVGLYVVIIKVSGGGPDTVNLAVDVQSTLRQIVYLQRDSNIKTEVQTWPAIAQSRFGLIPIEQAQLMVVKSVKDQAATFAADFRAANPKHVETKP